MPKLTSSPRFKPGDSSYRFAVDRGWRICGRRFGFLGTRRLP